MADLTDAQYLAAARALLGIKPEQDFSDAFVADRTEALLNPAFVRAALAIAFEAGRGSVLADHEVIHEWGTRFHFGGREPFVSSSRGCDEPEELARFRARLNGLRADRTEVVRRDRSVGPWEVQP